MYHITQRYYCSSFRKYLPNAELIVIDECSTIENLKMKEVLKRIGSSLLILTGDIYLTALGY